MTGRALSILLAIVLLAPGGARAQAAQAGQGGEDVARRQLESGRAFARQGNYDEAIRDFQAVATTHAGSSVADDAWLELARYYVDVARDMTQAQAAVDAILTGYATSDSAPDAYVIAGRLAMARGRQPEQLDAALANFDRVSRLFPNAPAVPRALYLAGLAQFYAGRYDTALANLTRVTAEHPSDPAAADAGLVAARVFVATGDATAAMEELQQVRNRFPDSAAAATALDRLTLLYRLYVRAAHGPAWQPVAEPAGPARLENFTGLVTASDGRVIWATERGAGVAAPPGAALPEHSGPTRRVTVDAQGRPAFVEGQVLRTASGGLLSFSVPRGGGNVDALDDIEAVAQLSTGEWLVADEGQRAIQRFSSAGDYEAAFQTSRVRRLAVSDTDRVAGIDWDRNDVFVFDSGGRVLAQIQLRTDAYDLRDAEDVAFDAFGHLYVLDRETLAVFTPYPAAGAADGRVTYRILTLFAVPENQPGHFDRGLGLAVDGAGRVYLYDDRNKRIQVYR